MSGLPRAFPLANGTPPPTPPLSGRGARRPLWLAIPTRFAGLPRRPATLVAALLALLLALACTALATPDPTVASSAGTGEVSDLGMYETVIAGLRGGGDYYPLAADALRSGDYPLKPFVTFRLPLHSVVQAALSTRVTIALLYLLAIGVGVAWWVRLRPLLPRPLARTILALFIAGGLIAFVQADLIAFHEIWAAMLVALSLALWQPTRWIPSAALALVAMLVRETAALLPMVMLAFAMLGGARREALGWLLTLLAFALALVAHAWGVSQVVGPLDPSSPGWTGLNGPGFFVRSLVISTVLSAIPLALAAPLVACALFGWSAWRDPLGARAAVLFLGYGAVIAIFARTNTFYWALMPAPVFLIGLVFVPDAVRDVAAALLDRRRVRVQRITQ